VFCVSCHRNEMVLPLSHASVDWSNTTDGGQHTREASIDIEACTFCHSSDEPTCKECH
jgi:formate hydrogenlyase subunit 6/NADH:ubiquinone oxidoreductase subunit I